MAQCSNDANDIRNGMRDITADAELTATPTTSPHSSLDRSNQAQWVSQEIQRPIDFHADLETIIRDYEISPPMAKDLLALRHCEIVIVCDDSGSMNESIWGSEQTRWDLLQKIVTLVLRVALFFERNGVDMYFLNREPCLRLRDINQVQSIFSEKPSGYTPLVPVLEGIFQSGTARNGDDKNLLVLIATDGAPTDDEGEEAIDQLRELIKTKRNPNNTFVQFLICTDHPSGVDYLAGSDGTMKNVGVIEDYEREKKRVLESNKKIHRFTFGDYIVKALVDVIVPEIDDFNEASDPPQ